MQHSELNLVLDVADVAVVQGQHRVLDSVSWQIERGQHWALLGPNGSGKTSLLNLLLAYLPLTQGRISVLGHEYGRADWRELRKLVGIVGPVIAAWMPPHELGLDVVHSGLEARVGAWGPKDAEELERAEALLARVEGSHLAQRRWGVLSQGERQRLLIGRALMAAPRLLILDEACASLDPVAREHFLAFIERLAHSESDADRAPTLIQVTHHVEEITEAFTHVLILKQGQVYARGDKRSVLTSEVLSGAFDAPVSVQCVGERFALRVPPSLQQVL